MIDLDKMEKDAKKKVAQHINKLDKKAKEQTEKDFAESRKKLKIK